MDLGLGEDGTDVAGEEGTDADRTCGGRERGRCRGLLCFGFGVKERVEGKTGASGASGATGGDCGGEQAGDLFWGVWRREPEESDEGFEWPPRGPRLEQFSDSEPYMESCSESGDETLEMGSCLSRGGITERAGCVKAQ